jgi:ankyrin repeat protein
LLLARADVHLTNLYGRTALHYAAMEGIVSACRALVDAGALSDELDHHGSIAVQHAVLMKRPNFLIEVIVKKPSEEEMLARRKRAKTT